MRIAPGIEILDIESTLANGPGITHPAVLEDNGGVILVDGGLPAQAPQIINASIKAGIPFEKLKAVIITHSDMDHIGCLSEICRNSSQKVEVISHEKEKPYIECDLPPIRLAQMEARLNSLQGDLNVQMKTLYDNLKANYKKLRVNVDKTASDSEKLPYCGGITVIHTPGHTPGHICLYLHEFKVLFTGDALNVNEKGLLVRAPEFTTTDPASYAESIKKLTQYDIETIVCFHGGVFTANANRRIAEIAAEL